MTCPTARALQERRAAIIHHVLSTADWEEIYLLANNGVTSAPLDDARKYERSSQKALFPDRAGVTGLSSARPEVAG